MSATVEERFWAKVDKSGDCWEWMAGTDGKGYGKFSRERMRSEGAHRVAYELLVGPIPAGLTIDHLCRNRGCVNPTHLEPVTMRENVLRGIGPTAVHARQTHCLRGHPYDEANTHYGSDGRYCRACGVIRNRAYLARRALLATPVSDDTEGAG